MKKVIVFSLIVLVLLSIGMVVYADDPCEDDPTCDALPPKMPPKMCMSVFVLFGVSTSSLYFERKRKPDR